MKKLLTIFLSAFVLGAGCCPETPAADNFIRIRNGRLTKAGEPYYYIGTNFWFGAILGSQGEGGNRERLLRELDFLKAAGVDNLRVLVGADGQGGVLSKVEPTLQVSPGQYNDEILDGLDFLMAELGKREMYAVLFLNNSWEWSGGYSSYLNWTGHGEIPMPREKGWTAFSEYVGLYAQAKPAHELFENHIRYIVSRTNRYTGKKYTDDPAIMSWQIGNEPRPFGAQNHDAFAAWIASAAAVIKSLDSNHLVSTGMEGTVGAEGSEALFRQIHSDPNIDYLTMHIWPNNWSWIDRKDITATLPTAIANTEAYMDAHIAMAREMGKPVILEEFGLPRDNMVFTEGTPVTNRDRYFGVVFNRIVEHAAQGDVFQGCNFWAWGGFARPQHEMWQPGDDYMGDPAQEEQGLNSVYASDPTVTLIRDVTTRIKESLTE